MNTQFSISQVITAGDTKYEVYDHNEIRIAYFSTEEKAKRFMNALQKSLAKIDLYK